MAAEEKIARLETYLIESTKLIKELNEEGVNLKIKVTNTTGSSHQADFLARKIDASNADIRVVEATRTESLISKSKGGW